MTTRRRAQSLFAKSSIAAIDKLLDDAAKHREPAPGLIEARDALQWTITANALSDEREADHNVYTEQSLLGALICDYTAWPRIADLISADVFVLDCHQRIFRHIHKLCSAKEVMDIVTLNESICASNEIEQVGGLHYLGEISLASWGSKNIETYAKIVRDKADKRMRLEKRIVSLVR